MMEVMALDRIYHSRFVNNGLMVSMAHGQQKIQECGGLLPEFAVDEAESGLENESRMRFACSLAVPALKSSRLSSIFQRLYFVFASSFVPLTL
jgi:hypothetical protein